MEKENHSRNNDVEAKQYTGEDRPNEGNTKEQNQEGKGNTGVIERRQTSLGK